MTNRKILLIDDDKLILRSFTKLLMKEGYEVIAADSFESAQKVFSESTFDLIVSDIQMPGKNGVETVKALQSELVKVSKKDLPIIFITGFAQLSDELKASFVGEVLYKPVDNERLISAIRDYL